MEHRKRGGDPNDIEREYNTLLGSNPDSTQNDETVNSESLDIEILSQTDLYHESPSRSSQDVGNTSELTSEQKARIERNRQKALLIRKAKLKERANSKET